MEKNIRKRILSLISAIVMMVTMVPSSVFAEGDIIPPDSQEQDTMTENCNTGESPADQSIIDEVLEKPSYEGDAEVIVPDMEESDEQEYGSEIDLPENEEPKIEYSNEEFISPETTVLENVKTVIAETGHAYVVSNGDVDVYTDVDMQGTICKIIKSGTIYYADVYKNAIHVWFADQNGNVIDGYINAGVLDGTIIDDENAADLASIGSLFTTINGERVLIFTTQIENEDEYSIEDELIIQPDAMVVEPDEGFMKLEEEYAEPETIIESDAEFSEPEIIPEQDEKIEISIEPEDGFIEPVAIPEPEEKIENLSEQEKITEHELFSETEEKTEAIVESEEAFIQSEIIPETEIVSELEEIREPEIVPATEEENTENIQETEEQTEQSLDTEEITDEEYIADTEYDDAEGSHATEDDGENIPFEDETETNEKAEPATSSEPEVTEKQLAVEDESGEKTSEDMREEKSEDTETEENNESLDNERLEENTVEELEEEITPEIDIEPELEDEILAVGDHVKIYTGISAYDWINKEYVGEFAADGIAEIRNISFDDEGNTFYWIRYWCDMADDRKVYSTIYVSALDVEYSEETEPINSTSVVKPKKKGLLGASVSSYNDEMIVFGPPYCVAWGAMSSGSIYPRYNSYNGQESYETRHYGSYSYSGPMEIRAMSRTYTEARGHIHCASVYPLNNTEDAIAMRAWIKDEGRNYRTDALWTNAKSFSCVNGTLEIRGAAPGAKLEIYKGTGNNRTKVATVTADANGNYDYAPGTPVFDVSAATAFSKANTGKDEWVEDNDCATYASLTAMVGGFWIYEQYADEFTNNFPGRVTDDKSDVWYTSIQDGTNDYVWVKTNAPVSVGDFVNAGGLSYGHVMFVSDYNPTTNEYLLTAHSTAHKDGIDIQAVMHASDYYYSYEEQKNGWVTLTKKDDLGNLMSGVSFTLAGNNYSVTKSTDGNGQIRWDEVPAGNYTLQESTPTGYKTNSDIGITVEVEKETHRDIVNTLIRGDVIVMKYRKKMYEGAAEIPLSGATLQLRIPGTATVVGEAKMTNTNGQVSWKQIPYGTYDIYEVTPPAGYQSEGIIGQVSVNSERVTIYDKNVVNTPIYGSVRAVKMAEGTSVTLEGASFELLDSTQTQRARYINNVETEVKTTDQTGLVYWQNLEYGDYYIREVAAPEKYCLDPVTTYKVTVDKQDDVGTTGTATIYDKPVMTTIKLYKRDKNEYKGDIPAYDPSKVPSKYNIDSPAPRGDATLNGAVFDLLAAEDIKTSTGTLVYSSGTKIETLTISGDDASATTKELWPGVYQFVEVTPPQGYKSSAESVIVDTRGAVRQTKDRVIGYEALKLNEVQTGKLRIVKIYGDNEIHTEAGLLENAEEGASFEVYRTASGSYEKAREDERDLIVTDKYGMATTKDLPYGEYTVKQLTGKLGYAIKGEFNVTLTQEFETNPLQKNINNQALKYYLKIIKIDEETGKTITMAGVKFKVRNEAGEYVTQTIHYPKETQIDTFVTDEEGTVTLPETVLYGKYKICEFEAPEGYLINTDEIEVQVGDPKDGADQVYTVPVIVEDAPVKGNIIVDKKGLQLAGFEENRKLGYTYNMPVFELKYLAGAVFEIHAREDIVGKDGTVWFTQDELVETITTTDTGSDISSDLPLGKYYLVEVSAPEGYIFSAEEYDVELKYEDDMTAKVSAKIDVGNDYLAAEVYLNKKAQGYVPVEDGSRMVSLVDTYEPGAGFIFGLYNKAAIPSPSGKLAADSLVAVAQTDTDGVLCFAGYYPHGQYYIKELYAPDGWIMNEDKLEISVIPTLAEPGTDVIRVSVAKDVVNYEFVKDVTITKTDITGEKTVPGALIEVYDADGNVIYRQYTDENGEIPDIPLKPGKYTFKEILAPEGYALNIAAMSFEVDEEGNVTGDTQIRDDYTRVQFRKKDADGSVLPGVEFTLYDKDHKPVTTAVSDQNGLVTFEKIPYGEFTVEETKTLTGYIPAQGTIAAIVIDGTFVNPDGPVGEIINEPNKVSVLKEDQDGNKMHGVLFGIFSNGKETARTTTDGNGIATFTKLPYGEYTIKELEVPEGYLLCKTELKVTIDEKYKNSTEVLGKFVNHRKHIKFIKVDTSGKPLQGVEFTLYNKADNSAVEVVTSDENGVFIFTKFDYGDWIVRETKVPEGFNVMQDVEFHVGDDWTEPAPITCVNVPNHYEFVKTDSNGKPLADVKFTIEDEEGHVFRKLVSGSDGIVRVTDLLPGTYVIREIETLEGYMLSGDAIIIEINEKYIVPDEMHRLINYKEPKTGVEINNPFIWVGLGMIMVALATMVVVRKKQKRVK